MRNGKHVRGETKITASQSGIARLSLVPPDARPLPQALDAIDQADIVSIGPGSLFTSCIPNLLVRGVPDAICRSSALRVYICNLMTQPNESTGLTASQHIEAIFDHAGCKVFDYVMLNSAPVPASCSPATPKTTPSPWSTTSTPSAPSASLPSSATTSTPPSSPATPPTASASTCSTSPPASTPHAVRGRQRCSVARLPIRLPCKMPRTA